MPIADTVFFSALAFLFGVATASLGWNLLVIIGTAAVLVFFILSRLERMNYWRATLLIVVLILTGAFYYHFRLNLELAKRRVTFNENVRFSAIVINEPQNSEKYQTIEFKFLEPFAGNGKILMPLFSGLKYGDKLEISGKINPPISSSDEPTVFSPTITIFGRHNGFWLKEKLLDLKEFLVSKFDGLFPADESALIAGITFGDRSNFSKSFKDIMSASGTTHLVALSGYNIAILVLAVSYVFGSFLSKRKTFYFSAIIIFFFVMMVGAEASVVRAAIMGFLALLAKEIGRIYDMRNAITLTAAAMVAIDPVILVSSAGFQLSFVSLLGIVYLSSIIKKLIRFETEGFIGWKEITATTLGAQIAVLPIINQFFGSFSVTALFANILILAFVPLTMFLGFALVALNSISFYLGFFAAKLAGVLLFYEVSVMKVFAAVSLPISLPSYGGLLIPILYYAILFFIVYSYGENKNPV